MNLRKTAQLLRKARLQIEVFTKKEHKIYEEIKKELGLNNDEADRIIFNYLFNGHLIQEQNAMVIARRTREAKIPEAPEPIL